MSGTQLSLTDYDLLGQYNKTKRESELEADLREIDPNFISLEDDEEKKKKPIRL